MRSLTLVALAATAAGFTPAMAQTVPDPNPYYGLTPGAPAPSVSVAPPGTTWHPGNAPVQVQMGQPAPPPRANVAPQYPQQQYPQQQYQQQPYQQPVAQQHAGYRHIGNGATVPQTMLDPQYEVHNWAMYGFPQPFAGARWIRYYDDALLIDAHGRVFDSRPSWDWNHYVDQRSYAAAGPAYAGGDYSSHSYSYSQSYPVGAPHVYERTYVQQAPVPMGPPPCSNVCGGGYGYGYGYGYGPVMVTETVVTEPAVVEQHTWVSYETVHVAVRHRRHVVRCGCRPVRRPSPGERG